MNTTPKHGLTNRLIAMLFVLTMTCVYVVGDNYAPIIAEQSKPNPYVISDETFLNRALDVLNSDTLKIEGRKITGYEESTGLTWEGYLEKAGSTDVRTFYPLLS